MKKLIVAASILLSGWTMANPGVERACVQNFSRYNVDSCIRVASRNGLRPSDVSSCGRRYAYDSSKLQCLRDTDNYGGRGRDGRGRNDDYGRGRGNDGGYRDYEPVPQTRVETFIVEPDRRCLRNIRDVDHADDLVSDGWLPRFTGQLAGCESERNDRNLRLDSQCRVVATQNFRLSCFDDLMSKVRGGTKTPTHQDFFRQACSDYVYSCTRVVY